MSFQRRGSAFDLGRRMDARFMATAQASGPPPLTLPTTNLIAAYDARVGVTNVAGACSAWADQSGNGWHATQATAGSRPTITTADGYASLQFDGTTDFLETSITTSAGALTFYSVEKRTSVGATYRATFESNNGGGGRLLVGGVDTGNYGIFDGARRDSRITQVTTRSRLTYEAAVVGASQVWHNGAAGSVAGLSSLKALGSTPKIGREAAGAFSYYAGHLFFLAIYTAARNIDVEDYITQEWGV